MKHCAIFAVGLLAATLLSAAHAQEKDAEKLFRDMEKKIKDAKAFEVVFTYQLEGKTTKGSLLLTNDNKTRLRLNGPFYFGVKNKAKFELVSDGKQFKTKGARLVVGSNGQAGFDVDGQSEGKIGKRFHALHAVIFSRGGMGFTVLGLPYFVETQEDIDPDKEASKMTVYDFKFGAAEKVGERQAKVLHYRFGKGGKGDAEITLWIDAESGLPLKRVFFNESGVFEGRITEMYSVFNLNPKIDAKVFELPK